MPEEMLGGDARGHLVGAPEPPLAVVAKAEGESVGELGGSAGRRGAGSVMGEQKQNRQVRVQGSSVGRRDDGCSVSAFRQCASDRRRLLPCSRLRSRRPDRVVPDRWRAAATRFGVDWVSDAPPVSEEGGHEEAREASVGRDDVLQRTFRRMACDVPRCNGNPDFRMVDSRGLGKRRRRRACVAA